MKFIPCLLLTGCIATTSPVTTQEPKLGVDTLVVAPTIPVIPAYDRDEWNKYWKDEDKDCQDTRQEVLIAESSTPPIMDLKGCRVLSGTWNDPYTGNTYTDPSILDIDHVIPLKDAHYSGGWQWTAAQKQAFSNDLTNPETLIAVYNGANRSKGGRTPADWLPPNEPYKCEFVKIWVQIKERYNLSLSAREARAISMLKCF